MKMKKFLMGIGIIPAMLLSSCSNEEPAINQGTDNGESFFATITLSLPTTSSRSTTDDTDEEIGKDYENNIQTIIVLLATNDGDSYKIAAINQGDAVTAAGPNSVPSYTLRFKQDDIRAIAGKSVYPFVICNPTAELSSKLSSATDLNSVIDYIEMGEINLTGDSFAGWTSNNFVMTNAREVPVKDVPESLTAFNSPENAFILSDKGRPIFVERVVARFDVKQHQAEGLAANQYTVVDKINNNMVVGYVTLTDMALININKDFYTFRRVSADGKSNWSISGAETPFNYTTSPLFNNPKNRNFTANIFANGKGDPTLITDWTPIASIAGNSSDEWNNKEYNIWRYATENALPEGESLKGFTTGVVFKGNITFPADSKLATSTAGNTRNLYMYGQHIYGNYDELQAEIKRAPASAMAQAAKKAGIYTDDFTFVAESEINTTKHLSAQGFTVYRPENGKYMVYYYYWNRHNDNNNPEVTGAMEFGVVRNNVYKLYVSKINTFGHPTSPDDDDTPVDPDSPDEELDMYFSLYVEVLPWTVRVNNIEF